MRVTMQHLRYNAAVSSETTYMWNLTAPGKASQMPEHSIYDRTILELAGNVPRLGRLAAADGSATAHSRLCGSTVTSDIAVDRDGRIEEFAHEVQACALGQAAAAIIGAAVIGADRAEIAKAREDVRAMLKEHAEPPQGRFGGFSALASARDYPARHAAILLPFDALLRALDDAGAGGTIAPAASRAGAA